MEIFKGEISVPFQCAKYCTKKCSQTYFCWQTWKKQIYLFKKSNINQSLSWRYMKSGTRADRFHVVMSQLRFPVVMKIKFPHYLYWLSCTFGTFIQIFQWSLFCAIEIWYCFESSNICHALTKISCKFVKLSDNSAVTHGPILPCQKHEIRDQLKNICLSFAKTTSRVVKI